MYLVRATALKSKDFAKAVEAAKLALELDADNMEAGSLLKKAEQALKAEQGDKADQGDTGAAAAAGGADTPAKTRQTAKPLKSTKGMFDSHSDESDDMFGD